MNSKKPPDDNNDEDNSYRYTPDDDPAVNPNTWSPSNDDTSEGMWNVEDDPNSVFYDPGLEPVKDPVRDEEYIFPLEEDEYPVDWDRLNAKIGYHAGWECEHCSTHGTECGLYAVRVVDPVETERMNVNVFESRCGDCTPDVAQTVESAIPLPESLYDTPPSPDSQSHDTDTDAEVDADATELTEITRGSERESKNTSSTDEQHTLDISDISPQGFFSVPFFPVKVAAVFMLTSISVGVATLLAGFTMLFAVGPSAGVNIAVYTVTASVSVLSVLSNPPVFVGALSTLYVLHLIDRDYQSPWRFRREIKSRYGAGWLRLLGTASILAGVGFTGVATQRTSMTTIHSMSVGASIMYFIGGVFVARELDNTILDDLDTFEMDIRAWMFAASARVGMFTAAVAMSGVVSVSIQTLAALVLVAPVTAFVYLLRRVTSYQHSTPRNKRVGRPRASDDSVRLVSSMREYHAPIESSIDTASVSGQIRARIDCTKQYVSRIVYRVLHNDRLDCYKVTHGKY